MSLPDPKKHPYLILDWVDINAAEDWDEPTHDHTTAQMYQGGWLVEATKLEITMANIYDPETGEFHGKWAYPRGVIIDTLLAEVTGYYDKLP